MKPKLLLLIILTAAIGMAYAQPWFSRPAARQPVFGIIGGVNVAKITGEDSFDSTDPSIGMHAGVMMQYNLLEAFYFQPGLIYTQKGYEQKYTILSVETKVTDSYDYIEMPLLFKLNFATDIVKIQPYVGTAISVIINAKSTSKSTLGEVTTEHTDNVMDQMRNLDLGFVFGADVVLVNRVLLGASYVVGMNKIYEDDTLITGSDVQNGVFMLCLGYLFGK